MRFPYTLEIIKSKDILEKKLNYGLEVFVETILMIY